MKRLAVLVIAAVFAVPGLADIYRWTDAEGNVHFSDEPRSGAQRYDPGSPTVIESQPVPGRATPREDDEPAESAQGVTYERFTFTQPESETTLRGNPGRVDVRLDLQPGLRSGHRVRLTLDGEPVPGSPGRATGFTLTNIVRGEHRLRATVIDGTGRVIAETGPRTFYMHRPSVNLPANPN